MKPRIVTRASRAGRILALAGLGLGVDDIQVQTGETYRAIAEALRRGPLARLALRRADEIRRAAA